MTKIMKIRMPKVNEVVIWNNAPDERMYFVVELGSAGPSTCLIAPIEDKDEQYIVFNRDLIIGIN
jgi:hypothetical protein